MEASNWSRALAKFGVDDPFSPDRTAPHMRQALRTAAPHLDTKAPPIASADAVSIPGPAGDMDGRLYTPLHLDGPGPCILFLHGGGYVIGDLETHDILCRRLAAKACVRVLALDYRLAPEHAFPAATDDALAAFDWLAGEGAAQIGADISKLAVAGDSAGGGLAAMLGQQRRSKIVFQLLIYPLMQLVERRRKTLKALEGHLFSAAALGEIARAYLPDESAASDVLVSPLLEDDLIGLPQTYLAAAELDPLLDEGIAYRDRLRAAGVEVEYVLGKTLPHGYFNLTGVLPGTADLVDQAARAVGDALRRD